MAGKIKRELSVETHQIMSLVVYEVSLDDLEQLEVETLMISEDFAFAIFAATAAISFSVTLATVDILPGRLYEIFWLVTMVGYIAAAYFGIRWFRGRRTFRRTIKRIKERSGPLGEEGREIDSRQLESLPPAEADKQ